MTDIHCVCNSWRNNKGCINGWLGPLVWFGAYGKANEAPGVINTGQQEAWTLNSLLKKARAILGNVLVATSVDTIVLATKCK